MMSTVSQFRKFSGQKTMMISQVVYFSKGVLLPPNSNAPPPSTREKPMGCKTIFVGGLPDKITEDIIKEIFENSGEIDYIRMTRGNFCHIRFKEAASIERALYYSGYKMKIDNSDDPLFTGRLHVDYAVAKDGELEYECQQSRVKQAQRHQEHEYFTTSPIIPYTEHEASLLGEKLRTEDSLMQVACVLANWLERGECTKRNAGSFYSMIQSTNSHVRRLLTEKGKCEEQLNDTKKRLKKQMEGITHQFWEIERVFNVACLQKAWDHFTKLQRRSINLWREQIKEIKNAHIAELIKEREDEDMDLSDDESGDSVTQCSPDTSSDELKNQLEEEISKLHEENDSLRCQLEVAQNKIVVMQAETKEKLNRQEEKILSLNAAIQNSKKRCTEEASLQDFRLLKSRRSVNKEDENEVDHNGFKFDENSLKPGISSSSSDVNINENDARLIGLVSTFLHVHPFGANIDYICSFLQQINSSIQARDVENLMKKYHTIFKEHSTGIGASLGKKWHFLGFES